MRSGYKSLTAARKAAVLENIRKNPSIRAAASSVGIRHGTILYWIKADAAFAKKAEEAMQSGVGRLENAVFSRAIDGVERYVVSQGKIVHDEDGNPLKIREYSDGLAIRLLQAHGGPAYRDKSSVDLRVTMDPNDLTDEQLAAIAAGGRAKASGTPEG